MYRPYMRKQGFMDEIERKEKESITNRIVITKRVAKHGKQTIIVIPKILEEQLRPGMLAQITFDVLNESKLNGGENDN